MSPRKGTTKARGRRSVTGEDGVSATAAVLTGASQSRTGSDPVNQAEAYEVRVVTAPDEGKVAPGQMYWRLVAVRHRTPEENQGKHNAYVTADGRAWAAGARRRPAHRLDLGRQAGG